MYSSDPSSSSGASAQPSHACNNGSQLGASSLSLLDFDKFLLLNPLARAWDCACRAEFCSIRISLNVLMHILVARRCRSKACSCSRCVLVSGSLYNIVAAVVSTSKVQRHNCTILPKGLSLCRCSLDTYTFPPSTPHAKPKQYHSSIYFCISDMFFSTSSLETTVQPNPAFNNLMAITSLLTLPRDC